MRIEVVYALAGAQDVVALELPEGTDAAHAVSASGLARRHALEPGTLRLGMFGERILPARRLRDGDRIDVLRPLAADPRETRRKRARQARSRAGAARAFRRSSG